MILEEAVNCRHIRAIIGEWSERQMTRSIRILVITLILILMMKYIHLIVVPETLYLMQISIGYKRTLHIVLKASHISTKYG